MSAVALRPLLLSALLAWAGAATAVLAAPVDEIRAVLARELVDPPDAQALARLAAADPAAQGARADASDAFAAALQAIDRHARHFAAAAYRAPQLGAEARSGIGARLLPQDGRVLLDVFQGGPADRAGIPDGARLLAIDGVELAGATAD